MLTVGAAQPSTLRLLQSHTTLTILLIIPYIFNYLLQEAYVAVLSIEAADVQVDCLHRLIAGLCAAEGGVELLCRLPWAHNLMVRLPCEVGCW